MNYKQNDYELIYMVRENDEASQDILFEKYLPIVKNIANEFYQKYGSYGYDYDDFVQEGLIAFQKSIICYNENKNTLFYTFTTLCIRRTLMTFCRNITRIKNNFNNNLYVPIEEYEEVLSDRNSNIDLITNEKIIGEISKNVILDLEFDVGCIFELRLNGFIYREIGIILDLPMSTIEYKVRIARKKFALAVQEYLEKTV